MKVYHQSSFDRWPFDDCSIQAIITSPPYYSLRKYDIPDVIIGGNPECEHEWGDCGKSYQRLRDAKAIYEDCLHPSNGSFCSICSAWKGQYGLEPTYKLYIEHTLLWCKEAWRVLRDDGVFFLNLGDSWNGGGHGYGGKIEYVNAAPQIKADLPSKCLLDIPARVSIALVDNQNWIKRNNIVWYSPNKMPESVRDRFSKKHEMVYMFSKSGKYYFDLDGVREEAQNWGTRDRENFRNGTTDPLLKHHGLKNCNFAEIGKNPGDIWIFNTEPSPEKHYAMWPQKLVERMILCSTKPGDAILDPFCGSGTTLRVADKLNREAYGIDLGYEEIQERRLTNIQKVLL